MENQLKKYFGDNISVCPLKEKPKIAIFLSQRQMYKVELEGISFVVIVISAEEQTGIAALKKQREKYEESFHCNIAFQFAEITKPQRNALIAAKIPFLFFPDQIYLPFAGVILSEKFKEKRKRKHNKMMPVTQQLFLYLLYHQKCPLPKSEAADALRTTRTSITRASEQLMEMGLIEQVKKGKLVLMQLREEPKKSIALAAPYLIDPVQGRITIREGAFAGHGLCAGESALSQYSMLNPPKIREVAVYKGNIDVRDYEERDGKWEESADFIVVEIWKYDPLPFAMDGKVDPVSLSCSLKKTKDERVEIAVEEMLEESKYIDFFT